MERYRINILQEDGHHTLREYPDPNGDWVKAQDILIEIQRLTYYLSSRQNDHDKAKYWDSVVEWCESHGYLRDQESIKDFLDRISNKIE